MRGYNPLLIFAQLYPEEDNAARAEASSSKEWVNLLWNAGQHDDAATAFLVSIKVGIKSALSMLHRCSELSTNLAAQITVLPVIA
jgi:hypothetical protein